FELLGDAPEVAKQNAAAVMRLETALATASMTRVERRDPYKRKNKIKLAELEQLVPSFDWPGYFRALKAPLFEIVNVSPPSFFKGVGGAAQSRAGRQPAQLPALPPGQWLRAVSLVSVCAGEFRFLPEVPARGQGNAAAVETLRAIYRSRPGRGAEPGIRAQGFFARAEGQHAGHGAAD